MIYLILAVAFSVVAVVASPLLLPQLKPSPEPDKSAGKPTLAIKMYLARVIPLARPPIVGGPLKDHPGRRHDVGPGHDRTGQDRTVCAAHRPFKGF